MTEREVYERILATPYRTGRGRMFHAVARFELGMPAVQGDELYQHEDNRPDTYEPPPGWEPK